MTEPRYPDPFERGKRILGPDWFCDPDAALSISAPTHSHEKRESSTMTDIVRTPTTIWDYTVREEGYEKVDLRETGGYGYLTVKAEPQGYTGPRLPAPGAWGATYWVPGYHRFEVLGFVVLRHEGVESTSQVVKTGEFETPVLLEKIFEDLENLEAAHREVRMSDLWADLEDLGRRIRAAKTRPDYAWAPGESYISFSETRSLIGDHVPDYRPDVRQLHYRSETHLLPLPMDVD